MQLNLKKEIFIMIELKTYETCELKKVLGIGKNTWNNNFDRIIELMDECFDYERVNVGSSKLFIIKAQHKEWPGLERRNAETNRQKSKFYADKVEEAVNNNPYTIGAWIGNDIYNNDNRYRVKKETCQKRCCKEIRDNYAKGERVWFEYKHSDGPLDPMNEDDVKEWKKTLQSNINKDKLIDALEDFKNGYIDELEKNAKIKSAVDGSYNGLLMKWEESHGYIPKQIKRLEKCAWLKD